MSINLHNIISKHKHMASSFVSGNVLVPIPIPAKNGIILDSIPFLNRASLVHSTRDTAVTV